jgi:predicted transcriptional regulator
MTVHHAISKHSQMQSEAIKKFKELEIKREQAIDKALQDILNGKDALVQEINDITDLMNELSKSGKVMLPKRKRVTESMLITYAQKKKS